MYDISIKDKIVTLSQDELGSHKSEITFNFFDDVEDAFTFADILFQLIRREAGSRVEVIDTYVLGGRP